MGVAFGGGCRVPQRRTNGSQELRGFVLKKEARAAVEKMAAERGMWACEGA